MKQFFTANSTVTVVIVPILPLAVCFNGSFAAKKIEVRACSVHNSGYRRQINKQLSKRKTPCNVSRFLSLPAEEENVSRVLTKGWIDEHNETFVVLLN